MRAYDIQLNLLNFVITTLHDICVILMHGRHFCFDFLVDLNGFRQLSEKASAVIDHIYYLITFAMLNLSDFLFLSFSFIVLEDIIS